MDHPWSLFHGRYPAKDKKQHVFVWLDFLLQVLMKCLCKTPSPSGSRSQGTQMVSSESAWHKESAYKVRSLYFIQTKTWTPWARLKLLTVWQMETHLNQYASDHLILRQIHCTSLQNLVCCTKQVKNLVSTALVFKCNNGLLSLCDDHVNLLAHHHYTGYGHLINWPVHC